MPSESLPGPRFVPRRGATPHFVLGHHAVADGDNTNIWLTGLPASTTPHDLLAGIQNIGRVYATTINPPGSGGSRCVAASISFFERKAAERFLDICKAGQFTVNGHRPMAVWNRNKIGETADTEASRVLRVAGIQPLVNQEYLHSYLSYYFDLQIDEVIDHGSVDIGGGKLVGRLEYRFGSYWKQAQTAKEILNRDFGGTKLLLADYSFDPCDELAPVEQ
ncbi:hypothetical protein GGR54DRAFT_135736 [Hypoxylon sp. NC1633]|nr:hypothetical protein GGR54DRAFT_135736 [Hypoxylon sp. NC1633]